MTQTPQEKAIEYLEKKTTFAKNNLYVEVRKSEIVWSLDICAKEAKKQGYEKGKIDLLENAKVISMICNAKQEGVEQMLNKIEGIIWTEQFKGSRSSVEGDRCGIIAIKNFIDKQKHLKGGK